MIDVTAVFHTKIIDRHHAIAVYEDHPSITPPWPHAQFAWENTYRNVYVASMVVVDGPPPAERRWESPNPINWAAVRWHAFTVLWMGGYSTTDHAAVPMCGPVYAWDFLIDSDGAPLDVHWTDFLYADHPATSA